MFYRGQNTLPINDLANSNDSEQVDEPNIYNNTKTSKNNENISIDNNFKIFNQDEFILNTTDKKEMPLAFADTDEKQIKKNQQKKSSAKKKEKSLSKTDLSKPSLEQVKEYFKQQEYSEFEAERFYNYYTSNGWLIGGKTKMIDWHAAARNWMLNTAKFTVNLPQNLQPKDQPRAKHLQVTEDKNYAEPL